MGHATYPPEPWHLQAHGYIGVYALRKSELPTPHAPGVRPITFFGRGIVATAFIIYEEPSPLTYNEVMMTVLVRDGWRPRISIVKIWVDSPASRDGGQELWAIPKTLADFTAVNDAEYRASLDGSEFAALTLRRRRRGWLPLPTRFRLAQGRGGDIVTTRVRGLARFGIARSDWDVLSDGPMAPVAGKRPLLTLVAHRVRLIFGS